MTGLEKLVEWFKENEKFTMTSEEMSMFNSCYAKARSLLSEEKAKAPATGEGLRELLHKVESIALEAMAKYDGEDLAKVPNEYHGYRRIFAAIASWEPLHAADERGEEIAHYRAPARELGDLLKAEEADYREER